MSRDGWAALLCDAMGLSAVCDCGISWSYSLTIFNIKARFNFKTQFVRFALRRLCYNALWNNAIICFILIFLSHFALSMSMQNEIKTYSYALKNYFPPKLFHSGIVFLLWWSIPRLLRNLGHSSFNQKHSREIFCVCLCLFVCFAFVFLLQNSKYELIGVMIKFDRASMTR